MKLSNFVSKEPRALPVFILADTSGSMMGAKINELNLGISECRRNSRKVSAFHHHIWA